MYSLHSVILLVCVFQNVISQFVDTGRAEQLPPGPPVFVGSDQTLNIEVQEGVPQNLECIAKGNPAPRATVWKKVGNVSLAQLGVKSQATLNLDDDSLVTATLTILKPNATHNGNYICTATNKHGSVTRTVIVAIVKKIEDAGSNPGSFIGGISLTIVVVTLLVVWIFFEFFHTPKNGLNKTEIKEFLLGNEELLTLTGEITTENIAHMPYNKNYEIPTNKLYVNRRDLLGSGAFGQVFKGRVNNQVVAVKTCKPGADKMYMKSLLMELKVMIYLGSHKNVIKLIGASTGKVASGILYIIVECCDMGNLEKYLRDHEKEYVNLLDNYGKLNPNAQYVKGSPLTTYDLLNWSYQIANGMEYLGSKKVIHGDLACRNILLADRETAKITDFGLARQLYDYSNYVKRNMEPLPWRWMAYEALRELTFSTLSDIWSYGVTVWEIFTLGEVPYPGQSWNNDFVNSLEDNHRLAKPKCASADIFAELLQCWQLDPKKRPSFAHWKRFFHNKFECGDKEYTLLSDTEAE